MNDLKNCLVIIQAIHVAEQLFLLKANNIKCKKGNESKCVG